jgi:hypothetical protein
VLALANSLPTWLALAIFGAMNFFGNMAFIHFFRPAYTALWPTVGCIAGNLLGGFGIIMLFKTIPHAFMLVGLISMVSYALAFVAYGYWVVGEPISLLRAVLLGLIIILMVVQDKV